MNKKGFTLVELLAVIIILVIIIGLSVVGVSSVIKNTKDAVYKSNMTTLKNAAQNYVIDNIDTINGYLINNSNYNISFNNLKTYINSSSFKAPSGGKCDSSYVVVSKDTITNKYNYTVYLLCNDNNDNIMYSANMNNNDVTELKVNVMIIKGSSSVLSASQDLEKEIKNGSVSVLSTSSGTATCSSSGTVVSCTASGVAAKSVTNIEDCQVAISNYDVVFYHGQCYIRAGHSAFNTSSTVVCGSQNSPLYNDYNNNSKHHCPGESYQKKVGGKTYCTYTKEGCLTAGKIYSSGKYACACYAPTGVGVYYSVTINYIYDV